MNIDNRVKDLAELIEIGYKNISLINSKDRIITTIHTDIDADYRQFGYNVIIPRWIFNGDASNNNIASEYANGLRQSEINYLIKKMEDSQKSRDVPSINSIDFDEISKHFLSLENVTDIFIPLKIFYKRSFYSNFDIKDHTHLMLGTKKVRIHISNKFIPFDKIFILDSSGVIWSQKRVEDMGVSRAHDSKAVKLLTNEDGVLQISKEEKGDGSVLFLIRLVAGAIIDPEKVRMINISKKLLEDD